MSELERLHDSGSSEQRALLAAARSLRASSSSRQRALGALGVATALTLVPANAAAALHWAKAAGAATLRALASKWGAGVVIGSVATGAATLQLLEPVEPAAQAPVSAAPRIPPAKPADAAPVIPAPPSAGSAAVPVTDDSLPRRPTAPLKAAPSELSLIDDARAQLASGNAKAALSTLSDHRRLYPGGRLVTESQVLRIEALAGSGSRQQALREARQFLKQHPNGLLSHRVRRWLDGQGAP